MRSLKPSLGKPVLVYCRHRSPSFTVPSTSCLPSQTGVSTIRSNLFGTITISNYYPAIDSQQYAAWNRTRRLRATPYLARTDTNTSRRATALATGLATANAQLSTNDVEANLTDHQRDKREETLFGPNVGIVSDGPSWAQSDDAKKGTSSDYLTPEIVRRWVEASKEVLISLCSSYCKS